MRTAGQLAGLAVVGEGTGERVGRIQDVLFEPQTGRITAFLVRTGTVFARPQILPRLFVRALGTDALLIEPGRVLANAETDPAIEGSQHAHALDGRPVLDTTGKFLGKVDDVLVSEDELTVVALVISTGLVDNLLHGKPQIPLNTITAIGKDSIVVPTS